MSNHSSTNTSALVLLVVFHILIIAASNYLVQLPVEVLGYFSTWGTFTFPLIFLASDLTVRVYGKAYARKIIFFAMIPALIVSYYFSVVFFEGKFLGHAGLTELNLFVLRIVVASFLAYIVGQMLDIQVFDRLRKLKHWWVAPLCSTFIGNLVDTACFYFIAFFRSSDDFMASNWPEIAIVDYIFKMLISTIVFLPIYGIVIGKITRALLSKKEGIAYDGMHKIRNNL